jgi:hypothetical protein
VRSLYDCPNVPVGPEGISCRVVVATHQASKKKSSVGITREGIVFELFFTRLPQQGFTASDVVELYLHRGAFEPILADEDVEQDPDRWCSQSPCGQECWQCVSQWIWNLRLELGHQLHSDPVRTTEFAPACSPGHEDVSHVCAPAQGYGPPEVALPWKAGHFSGRDFSFQPDGTLCCPAGQTLSVHERRPETDGSLRVVYAASIRSCRPCALREQCQWLGNATKKPRQVSVLLHPLVVGSAPLLWHDWSRRRYRRACIQLLRSQRVDVQQHAHDGEVRASLSPPALSRAQRAHYRLSFAERFARNVWVSSASRPMITLFGVPEAFSVFLGLAAT